MLQQDLLDFTLQNDEIGHFLFQTVKAEGPLALYKGFIPTWLRLGPWNIIFFVTFEQLKKFY